LLFGHVIYRVNYYYDKAGRLIGLTDPNAYLCVADFGYSPNGARTMLKYYPAGNPDNPLATIGYDYNADNFLKSFTTAGATFSFDANSIDGLGRLVSADETLIDPNGDPVTHSLAYSYDGLGQLLSVSMTNINSYTWSAEYDYNKDGNIDSKTVNSDTTDFDYDGDLMTDIGDDELTWDYNGQLTESVIASLEYNWSGKLRKAKIGGSDVIKSLKYDPMGNRVYKEIPGSPDVKRKYIVDVAGRLPVILLVMDAGNDNSVERSYVYAGAQPITFYEGDYTDPAYIYLHDRLGSVRQVLDESGNVKNTYTYTPFGTDPNSQFAETVDNPFRFTGQWFDDEIDQYYLRARQYEPVIMRFISRDSMMGEFEQPLTLHKYLYCFNNPTTYVDLNGKWAMYVTFTSLASFGGSGMGQLGFAWDDDGNFGLMAMRGIGAGTPDAGIGVNFFSLTSADTIYDLEGVGGSIGGSVKTPWGSSFGMEYVTGRGRNKESWHGLELNLGISLALAETHGFKTDTVILSKEASNMLFEAATECKTYGEGRALLMIAGWLE
jgi:RHS repeat-associated protein